MNEIFDHEFDEQGITRYGEQITRDDVVEILNTFVNALRVVEIESLRNWSASHEARWLHVYRITCSALNNAEIITALDADDVSQAH